MRLGETVLVSIQQNMDVVWIWSDYSLEGVIDMSDKCNDASPPDARINWGHGDHLAVVYTFEAIGMVQIYDANGQFLLSFMAGDTFPKSYSNWLSVYRLNTGEYQINIRDHEDKLIEIISDTLSFINPTIRHWERTDE